MIRRSQETRSTASVHAHGSPAIVRSVAGINRVDACGQRTSTSAAVAIPLYGTVLEFRSAAQHLSRRLHS